jgi:hypothetical protein
MGGSFLSRSCVGAILALIVDSIVDKFGVTYAVTRTPRIPAR